MITCGIDVGSLSAEAVIFVDGKLEAYSLIRTGYDSAQTALDALRVALEKTEVRQEDIEYTVATGYGRVIVPFADRNITEISCHAKGAHFFHPEVRTILDMGGQDCKAIRCDDKGKVTKFLMNDKCAAGTGRSMEVMAGLLEVRLEDIGPLSLAWDGDKIKISNTCVIFAKSEVLSLIREGVPVNAILAGLCEGVAERVRTLLRRVGVEKEFGISGGISKNIGVVRRVEEKIGFEAHIAFEPQIVGAVGAAIFAAELLAKKGPRVRT
ncbi:MAG: benzoyl-CoA reductase, bzd-type, subunit Q [Proteobacteria bacterium]|nr:benzoyl-CoA reductase, bzd-type, subunit Q [Pseudomonadota bacterium]